jgi:hypothetical protein
MKEINFKLKDKSILISISTKSFRATIVTKFDIEMIQE